LILLEDIDLPVSPGRAADAVFGVVSRHIDRGEIAKLQQALPEELRERWPTLLDAPQAVA
jgi:uncharacterized protein (DUF2267 family)